MNSISFPVRSAYTDYGKFASGKKIQNASDGAAELAILQKQEEQTRGYEAGKRNISVMKNLTNVLDAAQSGTNDYLQRMNELSIRAGNSLMSQSDRASIQQEVDMLKEGISQLASTAKFNEKNLMDGSVSLKVAKGPDAMDSILTSNSTMESIGLGDFSITGKNNAKQITQALTQISQQRVKTEVQAKAEEQKRADEVSQASRKTPSYNPEKDSGTMSTIATSNSELETMGLADFSLTDKNNSKQIINALKDITQQRIRADAQERKAEQKEENAAGTVRGMANLTDGSNPAFNAEKGSGTMAAISTSNSAKEAIGLGNFSITGKYNARQITDALSELTRQRSKTGAQANGLDSAYRVQDNASYNTTAAKSRIGDLDYPKAISDQRKKEVLQEYSNFVQRINMRIQGDKVVFFE